MIIRRIEEPAEKEQTAREILEALTEWFEVPETREGYVRDSRGMLFFAAEQDGEKTGFLCLKETGRSTVELAVMGVKKPYHRRGTGKALFNEAKAFAIAAGVPETPDGAAGKYQEMD